MPDNWTLIKLAGAELSLPPTSLADFRTLLEVCKSNNELNAKQNSPCELPYLGLGSIILVEKSLLTAGATISFTQRVLF